ncbi:MAG: mechanosensitive ion channel family protein [Gemmatimonadales bacterium]
MIAPTSSWDLFQPLTWGHVLAVVGIVVVAQLLGALVRRAFRAAAERAAPRYRLVILRVSPILRLALGIAALVLIIPILVEPTLENVAMLVAGVGLAIAFALKDYVSALVAGLVAVLENVYQPGDWIELAGTYGEVRAITLRAVHLVSADDTVVIIPHSKLWSAAVANATSGSRSLLCVTRFYLHPDHDGAAVRRTLEQVAAEAPLRRREGAVTVVATELPWGTEYKLKVYVGESREQFNLGTDLTLRGKAALRALGVRLAQAPYAAGGG